MKLIQLLCIHTACFSARSAPISYLGSVRMRPSLEVDDAIGVTRACFCVFLHRPLLGHRRRQAGVLTQLHVRVLGGQAGREANMLPHQPPAAAPDEHSTLFAFVHLLHASGSKIIPMKTIWNYFMIITVRLHIKA